jgi:hypothetical protein
MLPLVLLLVLLAPSAAQAEKLALEHDALPLHRQDPERRQVGRLAYRGGLHIRAAKGHRRFGEISGLLVSPDGRRMVAVQDFGWWLTAELVHDAGGNLTGIRNAEIAPMLDVDGKPLEGRAADAEGLTYAAGAAFGGDVLVSFEHQHRVDRYPFGTDGFLARPHPVPLPPEVRQAPDNGGLEALVTLSDGRLLLLTELYSDEKSNLRGWLVRDSGFGSVRLARSDLFAASDAALLPGGDVVLLERLFFPGLARAARLRRIPQDELQPGTVLRGEVLAQMGKKFEIDNMEALAVRSTKDGKTLLYVASDDGGSSSQRTLLLLFELMSDSTP